MRSPRVPLFATSRSPAVSRRRPVGTWPGAKVFQVAPVVEVNATAGDEDVTGSARKTTGVAVGDSAGEAAARDLLSLGEDPVSGGAGSARRATIGDDEANAGVAFPFFSARASVALLRPI